MYQQFHFEEVVGLDEDSWMHRTRKRLIFESDGPKHEEHLIYRVHSVFRNVNARCYEPVATSIGPYHHGKKHLLDMETHKKRYFRHLLSRNENVGFEDLVKMMKETEEQVRACYPGKIELESNAFVEMMLLDGCFIVELLLKLRHRNDVDDLFVGPPWRPMSLKNRDLLLLENQLPFFLLQGIFKKVMPNEDHWALVKYSLNLLKFSFPTLIGFHPLMAPESVHHLLHLLYTHLIRTPAEQLQEHLIGIPAKQLHVQLQEHLIGIPTEQLQDSKILNLAQCFGMCNCCEEATEEQQKLPWIPSVTQLKEAGVKFEVSSNNNFLDIKFCNGVMKIPAILVHLDTETQLRNLLAFEQYCLPPFYLRYQYYLSAYVCFLDFLINTSKDVEILNQEGILTHWLGEDKQVARLFNNNLAQGLIGARPNYLSATIRRVNDYRSRKIYRWRASLVRDYFYSPWAVLSFLASIVALSLTAISAMYSIKSFNNDLHCRAT